MSKFAGVLKAARGQEVTPESAPRVLRQDHRAGEKAFSDFAGTTLPIVDERTGEVTPAQIKAIRTRCKASQAVFAKYINVSTSSLQKWEIGEKKPSNVALKLLNVVDRKGLEALI